MDKQVQASDLIGRMVKMTDNWFGVAEASYNNSPNWIGIREQNGQCHEAQVWQVTVIG